MYNVLLVSNSPIVIRGLQDTVKEAIDKVVIHVTNSFEQIESLLTVDIQMVVVNQQITQPISVTLETHRVIESLLQKHPSLKIIVIYDKFEKDLFEWMYLVGVSGIIGKTATLQNFHTCFQLVLNDKIYIENDILVNLLSTTRQEKIHLQKQHEKVEFTKREKLVIELLTEGKTNTQICTILQLRPSTVSTFKRRVFEKLNITNLIQLAQIYRITA